MSETTVVQTHYEVLGVKPTATPSETYLALALAHHPDKNSAPGATRDFQVIADAYYVLQDPDRRAAYDAKLVRERRERERELREQERGRTRYPTREREYVPRARGWDSSPPGYRSPPAAGPTPGRAAPPHGGHAHFFTFHHYYTQTQTHARPRRSPRMDHFRPGSPLYHGYADEGAFRPGVGARARSRPDMRRPDMRRPAGATFFDDMFDPLADELYKMRMGTQGAMPARTPAHSPPPAPTPERAPDQGHTHSAQRPMPQRTFSPPDHHRGAMPARPRAEHSDDKPKHSVSRGAMPAGGVIPEHSHRPPPPDYAVPVDQRHAHRPPPPDYAMASKSDLDMFTAFFPHPVLEAFMRRAQQPRPAIIVMPAAVNPCYVPIMVGTPFSALRAVPRHSFSQTYFG